MPNTYSRRFVATCPNNSEAIIYDLRITVPDNRRIPVEHIVTACALHRKGFHEAIAADLFDRFGGFQVLTAHHHGVDIETTRGAL